MELLKNIKNVILAIGIVATLLGTAFAVERYFAKQKDMEKVEVVLETVDTKFVSQVEFAALEKRINLDILNDQMYRVQQRVWVLEDRLNEISDPNAKRAIKNEIRELEVEKQKLKEKIEHDQKDPT